jgi:hypothetical protein
MNSMHSVSILLSVLRQGIRHYDTALLRINLYMHTDSDTAVMLCCVLDTSSEALVILVASLTLLLPLATAVALIVTIG